MLRGLRRSLTKTMDSMSFASSSVRLPGVLFRGGIGGGLGDGGRGGFLGFGVGGDAGDVEEGGGGAAGDFGFFGFVGEGDEAGGAVGCGAEGDELDLEAGDLDFGFEEGGGFGGLEGFVEVVEGAVEFGEEVVEGEEGSFEQLAEVFGVEFEGGGGDESECGLHEGLLG